MALRSCIAVIAGFVVLLLATIAGPAGCSQNERHGDAFGLDPVSTAERPGFLVPATNSVPLADVRRQVLSRLEEEVGGDGSNYAFLPYDLPDGFSPAITWGEDESGEVPNPATSGRFYAAAFTDGNSVIRMAVNPRWAPSGLDWTLPPGGLDWERTGAGCMLRDAYEAIRDGLDYFRIKMPEDELVVYGPGAIRAQIWEVAEGIAPVVIGGAREVPVSMPADFQVRLEWGVGAKNVLDTTAGTFTKDMVLDPAITIELGLTREEMSEIYQRLRDIDYWAYPTSLSNEGLAVTPSSRYVLRVSGEGLGHYVAGDDWWVGHSLQVVAIFKLVERIRQMIEEKDEYKALPEPRGGYA